MDTDGAGGVGGADCEQAPTVRVNTHRARSGLRARQDSEKGSDHRRATIDTPSGVLVAQHSTQPPRFDAARAMAKPRGAPRLSRDAPSSVYSVRAEAELGSCSRRNMGESSRGGIERLIRSAALQDVVERSRARLIRATRVARTGCARSWRCPCASPPPHLADRRCPLLPWRWRHRRHRSA